jgi:hypothetical protein
MVVGTGCAVLHPKIGARPETQRLDDDRGRAEWIESMHRTTSGVNWRKVERENRRQSLARLAETAAAGAAPGGVWQQRGPINQTGRTFVTAVTGDGETLLLGSGDQGGGLFSGTPGGAGWAERAATVGAGVQQLLVVPGAPESWIVVVDGYSVPFLSPNSEVFVSTNQGGSWAEPHGLPAPTDGFHVTRILREPGASRTVYLLLTTPSEGPTTSYTLLRSEDGGLDFTAIASGSTAVVPDIWLSRIAAGPLYLLTDTGLHASMDHGTSFSLVGRLPGASGDSLHLAGSEAGAPSFYVLAGDSVQNRAELFASADGGRSWIDRGSVVDGGTFVDDPYMALGVVTASISNPNLVVLGGIDAYRSTDGAATFQAVSDWRNYSNDPAHLLHADVRGIDCIRYRGTETFFAATDGGTYMSTDLGGGFDNITLSGIINGEYYSTLTSKNDPNLVAGGSQDQGFQQSQSASRAAMTFSILDGGDYGHLTSSAGDHNMLYAAVAGNSLVVVLDRESPPQTVTWLPAYPAARNRSWLPFILADPTDANVVYLAGDPLYRANLDAAGWHWTALPQNFSAGNSDYLTALAISRVNPSYWYAASANGRFWYSHNQGASWTQSTTQGPLAENFYGTALVCSPAVATTCYVGGSGYGNPAVYKTTDGGVTWHAMADGLPSTLVLGLAFDDPERQDLYAAADAGAFVFDAATATWKSIVSGNAPLQDYWSVEGVPGRGAVRFGTYGKGIWDYLPVPPSLQFHTLAPCRVVDTRNAPGTLAGPALQALANRVFATIGICGIPAAAQAVSVNVTVVGATVDGYLTLGASDRALPATSTISYRAGAVRANNAIVGLSGDGAGGIAAFNSGTAAVEFILDVNGYFE